MSEFSAKDREFMQRSLQLAEQGMFGAHPNPMVGCVLVRDGAVVGEGWHKSAGEPHADINALQSAGDDARGATAYVTLEPCLMCAGAMIHARLERIVFGADDPKTGAAGGMFDLLADPAHNHAAVISGGCLAEQSSALLRDFFRERR